MYFFSITALFINTKLTNGCKANIVKGVLDFFNSALPWIGIGLGVAFFSVKMKAIKDEKKLGIIFNDLSWCPALIFLYLTIADMCGGNRSSGTTWLVLGAFYTIINFRFIKNEKEKK